MDERKICPKIENVFPNVMWENIWENLSHGFIPSDCKSQMFLLYSDLIISKDKLMKYNIGRLSTNICEYCQIVESNKHILTQCVRTLSIRTWLANTLEERVRIKVDDPEDILSWKIDTKNKRHKAAMWLTMFTYTYILSSYPNCSLFVLKKNIRETRWNSRKFFQNCFGNWLNIE